MDNSKKFQLLKNKMVEIKDLRHAIAEAKKHGLHKNDPEGVQMNKPKKIADIKHLGIVNAKNGQFKHILGREGDDKKYHVIFDSNRVLNKEPGYSVSVLNKEEKEVSRSPQYYSDIKDVVKAIVAFEKNNKW